MKSVWAPQLYGHCCEDNDFVEMFAGAGEVSASLREVWVIERVVGVCSDCLHGFVCGFGVLAANMLLATLCT